MAFEVFDKRMAPLGKTPSVTIQKKGIFSLNRAAAALMDNPQAVELLFDKEEQIIGLRPIDEASPHAYPLRPQSAHKETGPLLLGGTLFVQHYNIDTAISRRWVPTWQDGILCIDLKQPGTEVSSNRSGHSAKSAAAT